MLGSTRRNADLRLYTHNVRKIGSGVPVVGVIIIIIIMHRCCR